MRKEGNPVILTTGIDLDGIMQSEMSQTREMWYDITYM